MTKTDFRTKLLEVGTQLFAERGLHGVSIRELSQNAGVSISMISYYFGGKEGLYSAVLQEQFSCLGQFDEICHDDAAPLEVIETYLRWTIQRHRQQPHFLRFYTSELTNPTPCFAATVAPPINKVLRMLADVVDKGIRQGLFRKEIIAINAVLALAGMINYFFLTVLATEELISHSPEQDDQLVQQYLTIFTKGIMAE
jgi:TetR/AcrR family transcriptional regulator